MKSFALEHLTVLIEIVATCKLINISSAHQYYGVHEWVPLLYTHADIKCTYLSWGALVMQVI